MKRSLIGKFLVVSLSSETFAVALLILLASATFSFSQTGSVKPLTQKPSRAPGNIQLPKGFVHESRPGIDSGRGAIVKVVDGFTINYDIGRMAGNYADDYFPEHFERMRKQTHLSTSSIETRIQYLDNQVKWRETRSVDGNDVMIVQLKDNKIIAAFSGLNANFVAIADSSEKVADFLRIVLTYQPVKVLK